MSLETKRTIANYQENTLPQWQERLKEITGFEIDLDIDWDSMVDENRDESVHHAHWDKTFFETQMAAYQNICADDLGKSALQDVLKSVALKGTVEGETFAATFENGVLIIKAMPFTNANQIDERAEAVTKVLSDNM